MDIRSHTEFFALGCGLRAACLQKFPPLVRFASQNEAKRRGSVSALDLRNSLPASGKKFLIAWLREFSMLLCFSAVILLCRSFAGAKEPVWNESKSTHFIVYYKNSPQSFIASLIDKSEYYYDRIASDLGFRRFNFWLWDNRAKIYIYDNMQEYQSATSQPAWSGGCAEIRAKTIRTFFNAPGFFESVLSHEMAHIIFREFVGFDNNAVALWLDEGVASYQERARYAKAAAFVKMAIESGNFINLERLSALNSNSITETGIAQLFYAESYTIVDFLIKRFGSDKFVLFCQNLRDRRNLEKAIVLSYPFNNIKEFEDAWKKYLTGA